MADKEMLDFMRGYPLITLALRGEGGVKQMLTFTNRGEGGVNFIS